MHARDGFEAGEGQYAFVKKAPLFASPLMFAVLIGLSGLNKVVQSFKSSITMNRTLGLACFCGWALHSPNAAVARKRTDDDVLFFNVIG